jgi:hypothetical protein
MAGTYEGHMRASFNMELFMNLPTCEPVVIDDKKYAKYGKAVGWTFMQKG